MSGNPGKTRTINFYKINDNFRIVDLPGYGYAKLSKSMTEGWAEMMEAYISGRKNLRKVVQLVDIRHEPSKLDIQMYDYLRYYGLDGIVVATKADKISSNQKQKSLNIIRKTLNMNKDDVIIPISSLKKTGTENLIKEIELILSSKPDSKMEEDEHGK